MKKLINHRLFWPSIVVLISLVAIFPLFRPGFYPFHDEPQIANLYEMIRAISSGQMPPRWGPDFSFGYGYPLFNFYYPLPFYLGSFFYFFSHSLVWSLKLVFALSFPLSGLTMYFFLRKFFGRKAAFLGSFIYLFTPYRAVDLYVRGAVGELWSFVFMPLVLGAFYEIIQKRNLPNLALAGISLAGLILSHNLSAILFLPFFLGFCLFLILQKENKISAFLSAFIGGILGLGLSAYYWLPAILEKKFIQSGTPFNPVDHFPFIKQLVFPSWGYGASVWGPNDGFSFQIGIINLLIVLGSIVFCGWKKKSLLLFFLFFFLSILLMNIRFLPLWQILPLASYLQFPWRMLMMTTLFSSIIAGFFLESLKEKWQNLTALALFLFTLILTINYFKPEKKLLVDDNYYLKRFFANQTSQGISLTVSPAYYQYSEDYLPLTVWTEERPVDLPLTKIEISGGKIISLKERSAIFYQVITENQAPQSLIFHQYFFPGWQALVNGKKISIFPNRPRGDMVIALPPGKNEIEIKWGESPLRQGANYLSLVSVLLLAVLAFKRKF